jgi:alkylation response protein AidB-like acyl-CoA dehydrogenase
MDFQLSDEQVLLRDTTRNLLSRSYDPESRNKVIASDLGWSREVWTQLAETGILGLGFDPEESGQIEVMVVLTEVGRRLAPEPVVHAALGPGAIIAEAGSDAQKQLLDEVAEGQRLLAFAHLEPGAHTARSPATPLTRWSSARSCPTAESGCSSSTVRT